MFVEKRIENGGQYLRSYPFRLLTAFAATFPKGTALGGDGKLSGIAKRRPLGGAGTAQAVTEGVLPQALTEGVTQKNTPAGINLRGCYYASMFPAPLGAQSRKHCLRVKLTGS